MFFCNSLAFSMIQCMLEIWSLIPLPFLNPACTSGSSQFTYCWSLAWRILRPRYPQWCDHTPRARHPGMWSQWALGNITTRKASESVKIPVELFQILKDDAVKVLHSICQQIWKTQQWPQDFHCNSKERQCQRMFKLPYNCTYFTY